MVTVSDNLGFTTLEYISDRSDKTLLKSIVNVNKIYKYRGFNLIQINTDN